VGIAKRNRCEKKRKKKDEMNHKKKKGKGRNTPVK